MSTLDGLRRKAEDEARRLGLPDQHCEEWKYTRSDDFVESTQEELEDPALRLTAAAFDVFETIPELALPEAAHLVVNLDGQELPVMTRLGELPRGVFFGAWEDAPEVARTKIGTTLPDAHALHHLSLSQAGKVQVLHLPRGTRMGLLQILHMTTGRVARPLWSRLLVVLEDDASIELLEMHAGAGQGIARSHAVTEIVLGARSRATHVRVQRESSLARVFASLSVTQEQDSDFRSHLVALGGRLTRNEVHAALVGRGACATLRGLFRPEGDSHVDCQSFVDHAVPDCQSDEIYKGILDGSSTGVFHGRVLVREGAQKTSARQSNRNILLSPRAQVNARPQLEIYADDVKCSHGSATGRLDEKALFFLRSRGFSESAARRILVQAFTHELVAGLPWESLRSLVLDWTGAVS